jgi:hypothetical protein
MYVYWMYSVLTLYIHSSNTLSYLYYLAAMYCTKLPLIVVVLFVPASFAVTQVSAVSSYIVYTLYINTSIVWLTLVKTLFKQSIYSVCTIELYARRWNMIIMLRLLNHTLCGRLCMIQLLIIKDSVEIMSLKWDRVCTVYIRSAKARQVEKNSLTTSVKCGPTFFYLPSYRLPFFSLRKKGRCPYIFTDWD